jgi:NitT/TauT family transport system permease protein
MTRAGRPAGTAAAAAVPPAGFAILVVAVWWAATLLFDISPVLLPSPPQVAAAFAEQRGYLLASAATTATEVAAGYALSVVTGFVAGILLAASPTLARGSWPLLVGLDALPKLALAPLMVVWLGFGITVKVAIVWVTCGLPIVLAAYSGLTRTPAEHVMLARSLTGSSWQIMRKIRLPFALPAIFTGLKIAGPVAVIGAVIGEFVGAMAGLGYVLKAAGSDTALKFAALLLLGGMSLLLFYTIGAAERWLLPWAKETTE